MWRRRAAGDGVGEIADGAFEEEAGVEGGGVDDAGGSTVLSLVGSGGGGARCCGCWFCFVAVCWGRGCGTNRVSGDFFVEEGVEGEGTVVGGECVGRLGQGLFALDVAVAAVAHVVLEVFFAVGEVGEFLVPFGVVGGEEGGLAKGDGFAQTVSGIGGVGRLDRHGWVGGLGGGASADVEV